MNPSKRMEPPEKMHGGWVLSWARSEPDPFFLMLSDPKPIPIHGLVVSYTEKGVYYKCSCDEDWECMNDSPVDTFKEALAFPIPGAEFGHRAKWVHRMSAEEALRRFSEEEVPALPADYASDDTIRQLVREGRMIEAIARLRKARDLSLWEAQQLVKRFKEEMEE